MNIEERVGTLEIIIKDLEQRLSLEECRWKPKTEVYVVWLHEGNTMSPELMLGIYSTQVLADAKIECMKKTTPGTYRVETVVLDQDRQSKPS